ncbi:kinase-like domain-containing protein [Polychytrium aggregatum]|uniref:kinase-like domain-containing protein n=1 Tax=Polychytrium aggregatum TaxID=110093 RepID=UPI0022FE847D|nr:kinase-like domain-containing protein [Polychytrium aggregatum]KAI9205950.1 kinase-like domain-containing protein [Polychytrium aggregatum]
MARKVIFVDGNPQLRKSIFRELQILKKCKSEYIVSFYGAYLDESDVAICMEYMDLGSFDHIYKKVGPVPEDVMGKITYSVIKGLVYLYDGHRIIHRDLKPSNILMNSKGEVKIADFGVSGQLVNSVANTFVGTSAYMAPERIQGGRYSVRSDVWSLGITLLELAMGKFPFPPEGKPMTVFELLEFILHEPSPTPPPGQFTPEFDAVVARCLIKDPAQRPTPSDLLRDPFVVRAEHSSVDMQTWAKSVAAA